MPAKPAAFDRSYPILPSDFCPDDNRNGADPLPPHLNAYFMDLDEFFQATGSGVDNTSRYDATAIQHSVPVNGYGASTQIGNPLAGPQDVQSSSPVTGMPQAHDRESGNCDFPVYDQPMPNFIPSELDPQRCDVNGDGSGHGQPSCKVESDDSSVIDLEFSSALSWNEPQSESECPSSCRFEGHSSSCENSRGSDDNECDGQDDGKYSSQNGMSKLMKKRGGGKPGRKRKREYIYDPKPLQHKLSQTAVPENLKNTDYWERRKRNNLAAKRSRENRRMKEMEVLNKCNSLEKENAQIRAAMRRLEMRNAWLEKAIAEYLKGMNKSTG